MEDKKNVTIYDLAKEAQVSVATISRVINNQKYVKEETKEKIKKLVEKYNFEPNTIARSLYKQKTKTIGFIIHELVEPFYANICSEAEKYCLEKGYSTLMGITRSNLSVEMYYLQSFIRNRVEGIVFFGGSCTRIDTPIEYIEKVGKASKTCPIVVVNGSFKNTDCYVVRTKEEEGFIKLVDYLVECGHRKIGLIGGTNVVYAVIDREKLFKERLKYHNIEIRDEWIVHGGYSYQSGEECMRELLSRNEKPTAICCFNDVIAIGAINCVYKNGMKVPDDFSIVGFDNIPITEYFLPGITTIGQNYEELGRSAIQNIIDISMQKEVAKIKELDYQLLIRGSSRKNT